MTALIGRFSGVAWIGVLPDRGSCAVCGGQFSAIKLKYRLPPAAPLNRYRRGTTRTGELDGAKEINGG
jgi:hypothetical protein